MISCHGCRHYDTDLWPREVRHGRRKPEPNCTILGKFILDPKAPPCDGERYTPLDSQWPEDDR